MEKEIQGNDLQKQVERLNNEIARLRESERQAKLESGLASAWGSDLPSGDKGDYLRVLAERRWTWNEEKNEYEDRLGVVKDFKAWRDELENSNEVFLRPKEEPKPKSNRQTITASQFRFEVARNPELLKAVQSGRVEVVD